MNARPIFIALHWIWNYICSTFFAFLEPATLLYPGPFVILNQLLFYDGRLFHPSPAPLVIDNIQQLYKKTVCELGRTPISLCTSYLCTKNPPGSKQGYKLRERLNPTGVIVRSWPPHRKKWPLQQYRCKVVRRDSGPGFLGCQQRFLAEGVVLRTSKHGHYFRSSGSNSLDSRESFVTTVKIAIDEQ